MRKTKRTPTTRPGVYRLEPGRYLVRAKVRSANGKPVQIEREIEARSPADADAQRQRMRDELAARLEADRNPSHLTRSSESVRSYARSWLARRSPRLRSSTRFRYEAAIAKLCAGLGDMRVIDVRRADVEAWHNALEGAPPTVNGELAIAKAMFVSAVEDLDLPRSPAANVEPRPDNRVRSRKAFSPDELLAVLDEMQTQPSLRPWYPLTVALLATGGRFGEASALRWEDLDESRGVVTVQRRQYRGEVTATKTCDVREVPLLPDHLRVLREHRRELVATEHPRVAAGYMFPAGRTELHTQSSPLGRVLRAACKAAGVTPPARLVHALRRAFNDLTRAVAGGEVVRSMTGHVTPAMTDHYSTVRLEEKRAAVRGLLAVVRTEVRTASAAG